MKIDSKWFNEQIERSPYRSQRGLAPHIKNRQGKPSDPASISRTLTGFRVMSFDEARQLSDLLKVPLIEVLNRAGIAPNAVPVVAHVDKHGVLHFVKGKQETVVGPADLPDEAIAIRYRATPSETSHMDGCVIFAEKPRPSSSDTIGRFCVVIPKKGKPSVALVQRGDRTGTVSLAAGFLSDPARTENVLVDKIAPVLWIRPRQ